MSRKKELQLAKKKGWSRLGEIETDCKIPLSNEEKLRLGQESAEALMKIAELSE